MKRRRNGVWTNDISNCSKKYKNNLVNHAVFFIFPERFFARNVMSLVKVCCSTPNPIQTTHPSNLNQNEILPDA
jgi:hypothetical protein